jgi:hypothetical protein
VLALGCPPIEDIVSQLMCPNTPFDYISKKKIIDKRRWKKCKFAVTDVYTS